MKVSDLLESSGKSVLSEFGKQPEHYNSAFDCKAKGLSSLEGSSKSYAGGFYCFDNNLQSLKGGPERVEGTFDCCGNPITSLEGAPSYIGEQFYCIDTKITDLHNIHKIIKHIGGEAQFQASPISSHVLGLLLIDGLDYVLLGSSGPRKNVETIINKHLKNGRDIFACQEELIENGFEVFAQL